MDVLKRDYLPDELAPLLHGARLQGTVAVQARQNLAETRWLLELASQHQFIRGVVGWVDLRSDQLREQLDEFVNEPKLVGVRHVVHDEPDDDFMLGADFLRGIATLVDYGLTYDLLLFPQHLAVAKKIVAQFPKLTFVLDHMAKPGIAKKSIEPWAADLNRLARLPNVSCKLSGMVTEARWQGWQPEDFTPYLDIVLEAFGAERLMIGSDWPVCTLSGDYRSTMMIVIEYVNRLSAGEREAVLGGTCNRIYNLPA